jgi:hypothetical protein
MCIEISSFVNGGIQYSQVAEPHILIVDTRWVEEEEKGRERGGLLRLRRSIKKKRVVSEVAYFDYVGRLERKGS